MRKTIFVTAIILAAIILVTGCAPIAKYYVCPDGSQVASPEQCKDATRPESAEEETGGEIEVTIEEPDEETAEEGTAEQESAPVEKIFSEEAQALFSKADKAQILKYTYAETPSTLPENTYTVSRQRMKVELENRYRYSQDESYDTVYLDLESRTATGYCEHRDRAMCPEPNKEYDAEYDKYYYKTPFEWLESITSAELTGRSEQVNGRTGIEVSFSINREQGEMLVDSFYGVPLEMDYQDVKYEFRNIEVNIAKQEDLTHTEV